MVQHLSNALRELIVFWFVYDHVPAREIAQRARCHVATVHKVVRRWNRTGNSHALPRGHPRYSISSTPTTFAISFPPYSPILRYSSTSFSSVFITTVMSVYTSPPSLARSSAMDTRTRNSPSRPLSATPICGQSGLPNTATFRRNAVSGWMNRVSTIVITSVPTGGRP
jgi:hypothetical protein